MTEWNRENLERKIVLNAGLTIEIWHIAHTCMREIKILLLYYFY
jgi:hypothetical protein